MLYFNGIRLPTPSSISTDYTNVVRSRDTLSGKTVRRILRRKKVITCAWNIISASELVKLLEVEHQDTGELRYWDEQIGGYETTSVYADEVNSSLLSAQKWRTDTLKTVSNVSLTFKEF